MAETSVGGWATGRKENFLLKPSEDLQSLQVSEPSAGGQGVIGGGKTAERKSPKARQVQHPVNRQAAIGVRGPVYKSCFTGGRFAAGQPVISTPVPASLRMSIPWLRGCLWGRMKAGCPFW